MEFRDRFATEEACRAYVSALRWPNGFICPECQETKGWHMQRGLYWCRSCGCQASVTAPEEGKLGARIHASIRGVVRLTHDSVVIDA